MKKFLTRVIILAFIITNFSIITAKAEPSLEAQGVILIDGKTNQVLYSKNSDKQFEPASTTKVMTALVVLSKTKLDDKVKIGPNPPLTDGTIIGVQEGETYTVKELLYGLLLESGNDCANALAEYVSGSIDKFAILMNEKAKELGGKNTNFTNPSGLEDKKHLTTPYDLALFMKAAIDNKDFMEIAQTPNYFYKTHPNSDGTEKWATNRNHPLNPESAYYYKPLIAGKTGYTPDANHTYTGAAQKGDQVLIAAFLNAKDKNNQFKNVGELFEYGFSTFETVPLIKKDQEVARINISDTVSIPLLSNKDVFYTRHKNDNEALKESIVYEERNISRQTIKKGDLLFSGKVIVDDKEISTISLLSGVDREFTFKVIINESISRLYKNKIAFSTFTIVSILLITFICIRTRLFIKRKKLKNKYSHLKLRK